MTLAAFIIAAPLLGLALFFTDKALAERWPDQVAAVGRAVGRVFGRRG